MLISQIQLIVQIWKIKMATYVIGDIQGCYQQLMQLLSLIKFNDSKDTLWFAGDLVNRGPDSLGVLRFVKSLGDKHITVLGNHDLHLLAVAIGNAKQSRTDTLAVVLGAPDCESLCEWLLQRPLIHYDANLNAVLAHAGIAPMWSLEKAIQLAKEVEQVLRSENGTDFLQVIYGDLPNVWDDQLQGDERIRCIVNYFTRMRLCDAQGRLDFDFNGELSAAPSDLYPWFLVPNRVAVNAEIYFGHWAALNGEVSVPDIYGLDTGCVWGNRLTAMCVETKERFSVPCGV